jgi:hypothetical protein
MNEAVSSDLILSKIFIIRGLKMMLDKDLAGLYGVETKRLKEQVKRNMERFPDDFMLELAKKEIEILRSQFATSRWGGIRYAPMAFTEQGVAMLASVLNSPRAIQVNIQIVRAFVKLRRMILTHEDLRNKIEAMEEKYDEQFRIVFEAIRELIRVEHSPKKKIGFTMKR